MPTASGRTLKNRFGSLRIGNLRDVGQWHACRGESSEILITQKKTPWSGIAIAATIEGIRPLLLVGSAGPWYAVGLWHPCSAR